MKRYERHRLQEWSEFWLPQFKDVIKVTSRENGSYMMFCEKFGIVDYYPKSDRLLIRESNEWHYKGLSILQKQFDIEP